MIETMWTVLAGAPAERERTPVRKHSRVRGACEGLFWKRTDRQEVRQVVLAAKRYELAGRQPGERNGPLGVVAIEVLELFANLVNFRTGQLDPAIGTLMRLLKRSRDAIVRALNNLRTHGFLDWLRRYEPTGNEGKGPQIRQASNAYRLSLPQRARQLLGRLGMTPPPPDDHVQAKTECAAKMEEHRMGLPLDERTLFDVGDNPLGQALARLGRLVQRESARQTESPSTFLKDKPE